MTDQNENTPSMEDMPGQHEPTETNPVEAEQETVAISEEPIVVENTLPAEPEPAPEPVMADDVIAEAPLQVETEASAETEVPVETEAAVETEVSAETDVPADSELKSGFESPAAVEVVEQVPAGQAEPEVTEKEKETVRQPKSSLGRPVVPEDFDWDAIGKKQAAYSRPERERLEKIYDKTLSSIVEHDVIEGTVVGLNTREVVVNIGFKSDAIIPLSEFRYNPGLKTGDPVEVYVESQEDLSGQLILSHKKARILRSWERINEAYEKQEIITGYVKCRTKGGLIVDVFGIEAFLPGSQIDVKPIRDYDIYVDKTMEFKVVKINHEYKNVVVSHKALIEDELEAQKAEIISKLEKGQLLEGTVKNITSYGVFIDLGGVDGLIHITDLSWGRINHPEEIVQLDQKINVVILDFDESKKRIALGLKQLTPHPWASLDPALKIGDKVSGKVVVIADYGAFLEVATGVEGLIHVSEMSWSQHLRTAQDFMKVGDIVEAVILTLDREERKMSLGIKQLIPDPWANITDRYPIKSKHKAVVRNFTNFGIFVELEEGVDGLIHISDLSWSKKIKHPAEFTKIGDEIEVVVLDVDVENRRLSLGHKQLEENPWDVFESIFEVGSVHKGTIVNQAEKGFIVALPYGVEGFAPTRHVVKEDNTSARVDEALDFKVIEFNKDNKKIILSHTKVYQDQQNAQKEADTAKVATEENQTKKAVKKLKDNLEKTTLGDLEALASLKSDMELSEKKRKTAVKEKLDQKEEAAKKAALAESEAAAAEEQPLPEASAGEQVSLSFDEPAVADAETAPGAEPETGTLPEETAAAEAGEEKPE